MKKLISLLTAAVMIFTVMVPSSSGAIHAESLNSPTRQNETQVQNVDEEQSEEKTEESETPESAEPDEKLEESSPTEPSEGMETPLPPEAAESTPTPLPTEPAAENKIPVQPKAAVKEKQGINEPALQADADFFDDFGDTAGSEINRDYWGYLVGDKAIVQRDPKATDAQNGKGYSFYTDGTNKLFIEHKFENNIRGKISVDFYDDGTDQTGRMAQVNLTGIANKENKGKPFIIGLGINQNQTTQGWSNSNYCARIAEDGRFIDTQIARTKGWHTFTMEVSEQGTELSIDGTAVDASGIPGDDLVTSFNAIQLGDKWASGGETYFDNIRLENMTIVDVDAEEAAKHDASARTIKVGGISIPEFDAETLEYLWEYPAGSALPEVAAEANNEKAKVEIEQATEATPKATITITAIDGSTVRTYTITFKEAAQEIEKEWSATFDEDDPKGKWELLDSRGQYFEVTDEQAHDGTHSFVTRGEAAKKSWIFKKFDSAVNGKVSVWFYDTMGDKGKESFQQVNIWAPFSKVTEQPAIAGLGTDGKTNYAIRLGTSAGYAQSKVKRTRGWHEFVFDLTSGSDANFYIDGTLVHTTDAITSIGALQMGDIWSTSKATAYYDDVKITEISLGVSGIRLDQEEADIVCGETLQLNATVLPIGTSSEILWTSSNEKIATVDENGLVTANGIMGDATITATTKKGNYTASCVIHTTMSAEQDATLASILIDGKELSSFKPEQLDYTVTVVDTQVPTVTAVAHQKEAVVTITETSEIPGTTTIEVTAKDKVNKQVYTVHFEMLKEAFFDDFSYTDPEDLEKRGNWDVQEGTGRRPGDRTWGWSADNVVLMEDAEDPDNTIVRLKAKTDGTGGENTTQSQIRYYEEKFGAGTYVARVWLYDNVMESEDPEGTGAWNAKDQALSTFFTINRIEGPKWKPYHESDFEYLFNGGWGMGPKTMWFTSWNSYSLETSSEAQRDQSSSTGPSAVGSLDGRWSILTIKLDEDGRTTYYIDGQQKASHANKDEIAGPQSIAFNLWFIGGGQDKKYNGHSRTYWEDVDWVYYTPDTNTTTAEVEEIVTGMKNANIHVFDDIASPDITLNSITVDGQALEGFNNENTEYFIELPEGTKKAPKVEANANNQFSIVTVTSPETLPGATTVYVTSSDLSVTKTYHLNFSVKGNSELAAPLSNFASGSMVKYRDVQLFHPQNADIYYTMDGSTPTTASRKYGGETIRIEKSTNIKAIAAADGKTSPVADFLYTVIPLTPQVVAHPDAAINGSSIMKNGILDTTKLTYDDPVTLELSMPESKQRFYEVPGRTDNYQFYYTRDGSLPTVDQYHPNPSTRLYEGPIEINKTTTVNFIAVLPGVCESYESTPALRSQYSQVKITIKNGLYDIVFDSKGGSNIPSLTKVKAGSLIDKPEDPTKLDFIFDGWYKDEKYTKAWDFTADKVTGDTTLYAKWSRDVTAAPAPYGALPSEQQMRYYEEELAGFVHYGPNTYKGTNGIEWGNDGTYTPDTMQYPDTINTDQWVETFKNAGFKRLIFTAKHHDGFRLFDTDEFSTAQSKNGKDILALLSASCTKYNMNMGLYLSPWDVFEEKGKSIVYGERGAYGNGSGSTDSSPLDDDYNILYEKHLREIFDNPKYGNNGEFVELWLDGANGSGLKQLYDFPVWLDIAKGSNGVQDTRDEMIVYGPPYVSGKDAAWYGNEKGEIDPNKPSTMTPGTGPTEPIPDPAAESEWVVWEGDFSIRPGWFYHPNENGKVKTGEYLLDRYMQTVGQGGIMLLNIPPNRNGLIDDIDVENLNEFARLREETFGEGKNLARGSNVTATSEKVRSERFSASNLVDGDYDTYWTMADEERQGTVIIDLGQPKTFDVVELQEYIPLGQRIDAYQVEVFVNGQWQEFSKGTVVGYRKMSTNQPVKTDKLRITISSENAVPVLNSVNLYKLPAAAEKGEPVPAGLKYIDDCKMTVGTPSTNYQSDAWYQNNKETKLNLVHNDYTALSQNGYKDVTFTGSKFYIRGAWNSNGSDLRITIDNGEPIVVDMTSGKSSDPRHPYPGDNQGAIVYSSEDLEYGQHTVRIEAEDKSGQDKSVLIDALIYNDEPTGFFEFEDVGSVDFNEGEQVKVNVTRLGDVSQAAEINVASYPGTAVHGEDFKQETITLKFAAGERTKTAVFETYDNSKVEENQFFYLELEPVNAKTPASYNMSLIVNLIDNDGEVPGQAHKIIIDSNVKNGKISVNQSEAFAGDEISITVTPDAGYELVQDSLKVNGQVIVGNSFVMPGEDVILTAEFTKIPEPTTPPESSDNTPSYDDGGPFIKDVCGNVFDRWGNKIYSAPACEVSGGYQVPNTGVR